MNDHVDGATGAWTDIPTVGGGGGGGNLDGGSATAIYAAVQIHVND